MSKVRVLIVDDAVVIRRIVSDVLGADPDIEVVGTAANGKIALQKIPQVNPDLITLDVEMPEMDGLTTLRELRKLHPKLPVIMFSTLTARGASATLDALAAGASDYVTKPANVGSVATAMARIREELIPKIKSLCAKPKPVGVARPIVAKTSPAAAPAKPAMVQAVVIGISTGGPNALAEMIPLLPANLPVPVLIVQHMPPVFTRLLAERLNQKSPIKVQEAAAGQTLSPGNVYIAPGDFHMQMERAGAAICIRLDQGVPENSCRPAADVLFGSAASVFGSGTLAVVMTGMGQDGVRGSRDVRAVGGRVIAQDEATSVVWGMPGFVAQEGLAEQLIPLAEIAQQITSRVMSNRKTNKTAA